MRKGLLSDIKVICHSFVDSNNNMRPLSIGYVEQLKLDNEREDLLREIVLIMRDTDMLNIETKIYIFNQITKREVNSVLCYEMGTYIPFNTTQAKIEYGKKKIEKELWGIIDLIINNVGDLGIIKNNVVQLFNKYGSGKLGDELILNLDKRVINSILSDEDFERLVDTIEPYFKVNINKAVSDLGDNLIGYLNYLNKSARLTDKDIKRLDRIMKIANKGEYK